MSLPAQHYIGNQIDQTMSDAGKCTMLFGDHPLNARVIRMVLGFLVLTVALSILLLRVLDFFPPAPPDIAVYEFTAPEPPKPAPRVVLQDPLRHHLELLQQTHLWELPQDGVIPPVLFDRYPPGTNKLPDIATKKKFFLHTLLPAALVAVDEVRQERAKLDAILGEIDQCLNRDGATGDASPGVFSSYTACLDQEENDFMGSLFRKYRTKSLERLRRRVNILPVSLILAQGALESSWGGSRFARRGNGLFGMWTWDKQGIVPQRRDEGKFHKIRAYDSILDSVRDYLLTINRHDAYQPLREIRLRTLDPLALTEGLTLYSERGRAYIDQIKELIRYNNLQQFDRFKLAPMPVATSSNAGQGHE